MGLVGQQHQEEQKQLTKQLRLRCTCQKSLAAECHLRSSGMFITNESDEILFADYEAIDVLRGPAEEWDAGRILKLRDSSCSGPLEKYWTFVEYLSIVSSGDESSCHYAVVRRKDDNSVLWVQLCIHHSPSDDGRALYAWHVGDVSGTIRCMELSKACTAGEYMLSLEGDGYPHSALLTQSPTAIPSHDPKARSGVVELLESVLRSEEFAVIHLTGFGAIDSVFPRRLLGWRERDLLDRSFIGLLCPEDRSFFCRALKRCNHDGIPQRLNLKVATAPPFPAASALQSHADINKNNTCLAGDAAKAQSPLLPSPPPSSSSVRTRYLDCDVTILMPEAVQQLVLIVRANDQQEQHVQQLPPLSASIPAEPPLFTQQQEIMTANEDAHCVIRWMQLGSTPDGVSKQGNASSLNLLAPPEPLLPSAHKPHKAQKEQDNRSNPNSGMHAEAIDGRMRCSPLYPQSPALSAFSSPSLAPASSCESTPETSPTLTATMPISPPLQNQQHQTRQKQQREQQQPSTKGKASAHGYRSQSDKPTCHPSSEPAEYSESGSRDPFEQQPPPLPEEALPSLPRTATPVFQAVDLPLSPSKPVFSGLPLVNDKSGTELALSSTQTLTSPSLQLDKHTRHGQLYATGEQKQQQQQQQTQTHVVNRLATSGLELIHDVHLGASVNIPMSDIFQVPAMSMFSSVSPAAAAATAAAVSRRSAKPHRGEPCVVDDGFAPLLEKINLGSIRPLHFKEDEADIVDVRNAGQSEISSASPAKEFASSSMMFKNGVSSKHKTPQKEPC